MQLPTVLQYTVVAFGGALGAMTRYWITNLTIGEDKYYNTMIINVTGCLIIGILWALFSHYGTDRTWYLLAITGIIGGYTTYSTFALDAVQILERGMILKSVWYLVISITGGLGAYAIGMSGTEKLLKYFG